MKNKGEVALLGVTREGLSTEVAFKLKSEGHEGPSPTEGKGRAIQAKATNNF